MKSARRTDWAHLQLQWLYVALTGTCLQALACHRTMHKANSAQRGNLSLHKKGVFVYRQENDHYIAGSAECFIGDIMMNHVAIVWMYTQVGNACTPLDARLTAVPLGGAIAPWHTPHCRTTW